MLASVITAERLGTTVRTDRVEGVARTGAAHTGSALGVEAAEQLLMLSRQPPGVLGVGGRDDVAVVVLGDGEQAVQVSEFGRGGGHRSDEHTSELQSRGRLVC